MAPVLAAGQCSAVAVMHSAIEATDRALNTVFGAWSGPVACYPDCGKSENPNWRFGDLTPAAFVTAAESWVARGVEILGGCCGIGPEHIKLVAERLHGRRWTDVQSISQLISRCLGDQCRRAVQHCLLWRGVTPPAERCASSFEAA